MSAAIKIRRKQFPTDRFSQIPIIRSYVHLAAWSANRMSNRRRIRGSNVPWLSFLSRTDDALSGQVEPKGGRAQVPGGASMLRCAGRSRRQPVR